MKIWTFARNLIVVVDIYGFDTAIRVLYKSCRNKDRPKWRNGIETSHSDVFTRSRHVVFSKVPFKNIHLTPSVDLIEELKNFILRNEEYLNEEGCWLGTWVHPQTGEYYLDVSTGIDDLETALEIAVQAGKREGRHIVAIFNPQKNKTIFLEQP